MWLQIDKLRDPVLLGRIPGVGRPALSLWIVEIRCTCVAVSRGGDSVNWMSDREFVVRARRRYLDEVERRLDHLSSRVRGSFAEELVREYLGGDACLAVTATSPHDLTWQQITIAVRTTGTRNIDHKRDDPPWKATWSWPKGKEAWGDDRSVTPDTRRCRADVAILALHDGWDLYEGWSFYVLPSGIVNESKGRLTRAGLDRRGTTAVPGTQLADAVRSTCRA